MKYPESSAGSTESPGKNSFLIVPSDTVEIAEYLPRGLYTGSGGTITMRLFNDVEDVLWENVPSGIILPVRPQFIRAAGTSAIGMIGIY